MQASRPGRSIRLGNFLSGMETLVAAIATGQWTEPLETSLVEWKLKHVREQQKAGNPLETSLVEWKQAKISGNFSPFAPWKLP